jgi:branched-chain amino acid transport system ATP-binding protein
LLGLGSTFQLNHLFYGLSVVENVLLAQQGVEPSRYNVWRSAAAFVDHNGAARQLLESVSLWEKRHLPVGVLSYGEQRKLEIVLGLAGQPKLLVMDEPTAGLALNEVAPFLQTVRNLAAGTTVLFTLPDMDVVFGLAERVIALYFGELVAQGTPDEIRENPQVREIYLGTEFEDDNAHAE